MSRFQSRLLLVLLACAAGLMAAPQPNIIFIFIDDMGYGDLSSYGNTDITTPNMDRLAAEGIKSTQFYVASPICSPSRVAVTTGRFPARYRVHAHFASREQNRARGMPDFLDPNAPAVARIFQQAGYATAHFGKWHMGGGRDVDDAPHPRAYGFDESLVTFEGLGDRVLINGDGLSRQSEKLGQGEISHAEKHELTEIYINRGIDFIERNKDKRFYLHLCFNDVHDAFFPKQRLMEKYKMFSYNPYVQQYYAVIDEMDRQVGRLLETLTSAGLDEKTLIVLASDNGPTAWPRYYNEGYRPPGSAGPFRGRKWSLYEGGIREPFIVRWKGTVPAGRVNTETVVAAVDLLPTFVKLAGLKAPNVRGGYDGVDMSEVFLGKELLRTKPLFWEFGTSKLTLQPGKEIDRGPTLAVRDGDWKLLMNQDGSKLQLYNLAAQDYEITNLAGDYPHVAARMKLMLQRWWDSIPSLPVEGRIAP